MSHSEALSSSRIAAAFLELLPVVTAAVLMVGGEVEEGTSEKAKAFLDETWESTCTGFLS